MLGRGEVREGERDHSAMQSWFMCGDREVRRDGRTVGEEK
jgi:hypothetical protein